MLGLQTQMACLLSPVIQANNFTLSLFIKRTTIFVMMIFVKHPFIYTELFFDKLMVLMNGNYYVCKV